jgi:hypothetical protein
LLHQAVVSSKTAHGDAVTKDYVVSLKDINQARNLLASSLLSLCIPYSQAMRMSIYLQLLQALETISQSRKQPRPKFLLGLTVYGLLFLR